MAKDIYSENKPVDEKLEDYSLKDLEVKRRLCEEQLQEMMNYSIMHRISKRIGYDIYRILFYFLFIEIIIFLVISLLVTLPVMLDPSQESAQISMNFMPVFTVFILPFMITAMLIGTDHSGYLRRRLKDIEQVIRIKQEVDEDENIELVDESEKMEYKSSFKYDLKSKQPNPQLSKDVVQSIIGFLNAEGGHLIIGVSDNKEVLGIDNDLKLFNNSWDKYRLSIQNAMRDYADKTITNFVKVRKIKKDGKTLCSIKMKKRSPKEVYYIEGDKQEFYIRDGNRTRKLTTKQANEYISEHWAG